MTSVPTYTWTPSQIPTSVVSMPLSRLTNRTKTLRTQSGRLGDSRFDERRLNHRIRRRGLPTRTGPLQGADSEDQETYFSRGKSNEPIQCRDSSMVNTGITPKRESAPSRIEILSKSDSQELTDFEVPRDTICVAEKMNDTNTDSHTFF